MANQVVVVTGASRGLGRAIALALAGEGYDIAVNYQGHEEGARETAAQCVEIGVRAEIFQADVADYGQTKAMIDGVVSKMGGYYGVIANSGVAPPFGYITDMAPDEWRRVVDVNLNGVYNTFHAAAPHLIDRKAGRMVAISSLVTRYMNPGFGPYAVTKAGVNAIVQVMGKELAQYGVLVNGIAPGLFDTDMGRKVIDRYGEAAVNESIPAQRVGRPEEVGHLAAYLLSGKAGFIVGDVLNINGGGRGVKLRP